MGVAHTGAVALQGLRGSLVDVEASIAAGLPMFKLIGLPDASLAEACHRVLAAAANSGASLAQSRLTVNLSPAALPKHGPAFDLAIGLAAFAASGLVSAASVGAVAHLGELGLDGRVRPVLGVLPAVHAAVAAGAHRVMVPVGNAAEAALVPGVEIIPVASLREAAIRHGARLAPVDVQPILVPAAPGDRGAELDLSDVIGNEDALDALIVAAAGGHHLLLVGPPGSGKTMLAERMPGVLPALDEREAIEATSIRSLTELGSVTRLVTAPPFEAPHHTASAAALVGGGSSRIRPGAAVRASGGVLFLDEAPEFQRTALDALRQPLESGVITISRAQGHAEFPARFQLVMAANPCPCGYADTPGTDCTCTPNQRRTYLARISGPLLDRIDIRAQVPKISSAQLKRGDDARGPRSADTRERVRQARTAARERLAGTAWARNGELPGTWLLDRRHRPPQPAFALVERNYELGVLSMRGVTRVLRVAWTLADLAGRTSPGTDEVGRAMTLRSGVDA